MDKNFKPVYVQGTETGKGVIVSMEQFLELVADVFEVEPEDITMDTVLHHIINKERYIFSFYSIIIIYIKYSSNSIYNIRI